MTYLDQALANSVMKFAGLILTRHFMYDEDSLNKFFNGFASIVNTEHFHLVMTASKDFKDVMTTDEGARKVFTLDFCGLHVMRTLDEIMGFTSQELRLFEEVITKYIDDEEEQHNGQKQH